MKLGRARCDRTVEHRLTFGQFERKKIDEILAQQERNIWLDAIPSVGIGALGFGAVLAGYGILRWAGPTVGNMVDEFKTWFDKTTNKMSDALVDILPPTPAEKRMEEIRLRLLEIQARQNEIIALINTVPPPPYAAMMELFNEGKRLADEEAALRAELDAYATGETTWSEGETTPGTVGPGDGQGTGTGTDTGNGNGSGPTPGPPHLGT